MSLKIPVTVALEILVFLDERLEKTLRSGITIISDRSARKYIDSLKKIRSSLKTDDPTYVKFLKEWDKRFQSMQNAYDDVSPIDLSKIPSLPEICGDHPLNFLEEI